MVLPAKIFEINEETNFGLVLQKLKDFREEENYETGEGETFTLVTYHYKFLVTTLINL